MDNSESKDPLVTQLQAITQGLLWISETDAPFEVIHFGETVPPRPLVEHLQLPAGAIVQTRTLEAFFRTAVKAEDWHGPQEQAEVQKYQVLLSTLQANLQEPQVYLVGEVEIDVFILGRSASDQVIGLSTKAVIT